MPPRLRTALVAGLVLVAAIVAWRYLTSPERRVLRRLDALMEHLGKEGAESQLAAAATARGAADFFAPGFLVRAEPYEGQLTDSRELTGAVMRFRGAAQRVEAAALEPDVRLDETARTAVVHFVGRVAMDGPAGSGTESWRVRSLWIEDGGEWRISELELLEPIESGGLLPGF